MGETTISLIQRDSLTVMCRDCKALLSVSLTIVVVVENYDLIQLSVMADGEIDFDLRITAEVEGSYNYE